VAGPTPDAAGHAAGSRRQVTPGARALRRLEQAGLIAGSWSVVAGRRRRCHRLTAAGQRALAGRRAAWREFAATVSAVLEGGPCPDPA
jgi:DNA-binding MarR family transcriptional regulator